MNKGAKLQNYRDFTPQLTIQRAVADQKARCNSMHKSATALIIRSMAEENRLYFHFSFLGTHLL